MSLGVALIVLAILIAIFYSPLLGLIVGLVGVVVWAKK